MIPAPEPLYRLAKKGYPYVPGHPHYGPGHAIPWPDISMLSVGYTRHPKYPGNLELLPENRDRYGNPTGGVWRLLGVWNSGWLSVQSVITSEVLFSIPPDSLELISDTFLADEG